MTRQLRFILGLSLLFLWGHACSFGGPLREDRKAVGYQFRAPQSSQWTPLAERADADHAWIHRSTGAIVSIRSLCERYEHVSLQNLSQSLIRVMDQAKVLEREEVVVADRAGLRSRVSARMDGVPVQSEIVVLRKHNCIFDFVLTQFHHLSDDSLQGLERLLRSFDYSGGLTQQ